MVFRWMEKFVEMDRGGGEVLTHGKRCAYCYYSNFPPHWYRLMSSSFHLLEYPVKRRL